MKIFLGTLGSLGDILPFVLLGHEFQSRGHQVILLSNAYLMDMSQLGLPFHAIFDENMAKSFDQAYHDGSLDRASLYLDHLTLPAINPTMDFLAQNATDGDSVLIAFNRVFGMALASEKWHIPRIVLHVTPYGFQNLLAKSLTEMGELLRKPLKEARRLWNMPENNICPSRWLHEDALNIGLFPEWFCDMEPAWGDQVVFGGFPLIKSAMPIDSELARFLDLPEQPLLFVDGTLNPDPPSFVRQACKISTRMNRRALIISNRSIEWQAELPPQVRSIPFAPYRTILPYCAAMIHHGGVGTAAEALVTGVPQLVVANDYDQLTHARLIEGLGVGLASSPDAFLDTETTLAQIEMLLHSQKVTAACLHHASLLNPSTAVSDICNLIESHWMAASNRERTPSPA